MAITTLPDDRIVKSAAATRMIMKQRTVEALYWDRNFSGFNIIIIIIVVVSN